MLGSDQERQERGQFARWLRGMPWCDHSVRAHSGFEADAWRHLIDSDREPVAGGSERAAWRRLVWRAWHCFRRLQTQRGFDLTGA